MWLPIVVFAFIVSVWYLLIKLILSWIFRSGRLPKEKSSSEISVGVEIAAAPLISESSWLNDPEYADFRKAYTYATTQTHAIVALDKLTPEEAYHLYAALVRGHERIASQRLTTGRSSLQS